MALAGPVRAFHRSTPAVTALTLAGNADLPPIPSQGRRLMALEQVGIVFTLLPFSTGAAITVEAAGRNPAVSYGGRALLWETNSDPLQSGLPGWQIIADQYGLLTMPAPDPSGTSHNVSADKRGQAIAFESAGDLTNTGVPNVRRVYVRDKTGTLRLASRGVGSSGNAMMSPKGVLVSFDSTSHPVTGADTGVSQIWVWSPSRSAERVTNGAGPSTRPIVSDDGRLIAFRSTADLAGDLHDTGTPQIFVYDYKTATFARLTNEPGGCTRPAVAKVQGDWRVTFVCGGQAYYHMLRRNARYHVPTPGGTVQSMIPEMGVHFLILSTNADLLAGSGSTIGNRIYMVNLYARPAVPVAGSATWFPYQGIPSF
jgi:hypothetical protein